MSFNKYRTKGAYHYGWYETEDWYRWMIDRAVKFCKGATIDLGGGDGLLAHKIRENGYEAVVYDGDDDARLLCEARGIPFGLIDLDKFVLNKNIVKAEYVACLNVIEHLNRPATLKNVLKNNMSKGAIITTIDYQGGALGEDHKFEWTYDEMMNFFKEFNPKGFRYKDTEWIGVEIRK